MFPLEYVLAVAVVTAAPSGEAVPEHHGLAATIREVALAWEVLDPRESFAGRPGDFAADLELVRRRYRELADAPRASDVQRFANREAACELLAFNREYYRTLKQRRDAVGDEGHLDRALEEVDQLYRVWDLVRDARSECYYVSARRQALRSLRDALGQADYYQGAMPPHVPVWRFDRRD